MVDCLLKKVWFVKLHRSACGVGRGNHRGGGREVGRISKGSVIVLSFYIKKKK